MTRHDTAARVADVINRPISAAELREALERPLSDHEREEIRALARWFCRRYPTPRERLAYARQAYRRWQATAVRARPPFEPPR
jgi:hypothetical protein